MKHIRSEGTRKRNTLRSRWVMQRLLPLVLLGMGASVTAGNETLPALPSGMIVTHGQASAVVNGNQMVVTNSANAILNWQSFSIGQGQGVRFNQPSSASQVLNRVIGNEPSAILGSLSSNGGVWLINPHGVLFGANARVDVAGLVASTLSVDDADWRARRYSFRESDAQQSGAVINQGEIRSTGGGRVLLVGGRAGIRNDGLIDAPQGQVAAVAGNRVELVDTASPFVAVRVDAPSGRIENLGIVIAQGGQVDIYAALVTNRGVISADGSESSNAGRVNLRATQDLTLAPGSATSASGRAGGHIFAQGGTTRVAGAVEATGQAGAGGSVELLGEQVGILAGASVDASGRDGGGGVLVGGGPGGRDSAVPNATDTYLDRDSTVRADATRAGNGGHIITWGNRSSWNYANLSARGGPLGGDGGFVETSGGWLDARPANLSIDAPRGKPGLWLLDPEEIRIVNNVPENFSLSEPFPPPNSNFVPNGANSIISTATINAALQSGNVTISTRNSQGPSVFGNIIVQLGGSVGWHITAAGPQPTTLTLDSLGDITVRGLRIQSTGVGSGINLRVIAGEIASFEGNSEIHAGAGSIEVQSQRLIVRNTLIEGRSMAFATNNFLIESTATLLATAESGLALSLQGRDRPSVTNFNVQPGATFSIQPQAYWHFFMPTSVLNAPFSFAGRAADAYIAVPPNAKAPNAVGNTVFYESDTASPESVRTDQHPVKRALDSEPLEHPTFGLGLGDEAPSFGPVDIDRMPPTELTRLLNARDEYKRRILGPAMTILAGANSPAELASCKTPEQLLSEDCMVTQELMVTFRDVALGRISNLTPDSFCHKAPDLARQGWCLGIMKELAGPKCTGGGGAALLPGIRRKFAVVIGVDAYKGIQNLQNAGRDAQELGAQLMSGQGYCVTVLKDPTRGQIIEALNGVAILAERDDSVLIYFAGHGAKDSRGAGYWLASNFNLQTATGAIANSSVATLLSEMQAKQVVLIADACYSGGFLEGSDPIDASGRLDPATVLNKRAVAVMTAGGDHPVPDRGKDGHSIFAAKLVELLRSTTQWATGRAIYGVLAAEVSSKLDRASTTGMQNDQVPKYIGLRPRHELGADYLFEARPSNQ